MILHVPFRTEQRRIARADGICHWCEHAGQVYRMSTESIYYHATLDHRLAGDHAVGGVIGSPRRSRGWLCALLCFDVLFSAAQLLASWTSTCIPQSRLLAFGKHDAFE